MSKFRGTPTTRTEGTDGDGNRVVDLTIDGGDQGAEHRVVTYRDGGDRITLDGKTHHDTAAEADAQHGRRR
jgi:hypothetical protein